MILAKVPHTTRFRSRGGVFYVERIANIIDVQCTREVSLVGKDGIRLGRRIISSTVLIVDNVGEPVGGVRETVLAGPGSLSSNGGITGRRTDTGDVPILR